MQPYINPSYFNWTPQFSQVPQVISGKIVENIDNISANDVSMQGISVFPKSDLSEIYVKNWNPNGAIYTRRFVQEGGQNTIEASLSTETKQVPKIANNEVIEGIDKRLCNIEEILNSIVKGQKGAKKE